MNQPCYPCEHNLKSRPNLTMNDILIKGCQFSYINPDIIKSATRERKVVEPRQMIMAIIKDETGRSLKSIGDLFGGRDHSSVINSIRVVDGQYEVDENFRYRFEQMKEFILK